MKLDKIALFLLSVGLTCFVASGSYLYIEELFKVDKTNKEYIISTVDIDYQRFNTIGNDLKKDLEEFNDSIVVYFEAMVEENNNTLEYLKTVEETFDSLIPVANNLENECKANYEISSLVKERCDVFYKNFTVLKENYVTIINSYNDVISDYNTWASRNDMDSISLYTSLYYELYK